MVRTRADNCARKAVASKAPRKMMSSGSAGCSSGSGATASPGASQQGAGGVNVAKLWPTPKWQKGIGTFFQKRTAPDEQMTVVSSTSSGSSSPTDERRLETGEAIGSTESSPELGSKPASSTSDYRVDELCLTPPGPSCSSSLPSTLAAPSSASAGKRRRVILNDSDDE